MIDRDAQVVEADIFIYHGDCCVDINMIEVDLKEMSQSEQVNMCKRCYNQDCDVIHRQLGKVTR